MTWLIVAIWVGLLAAWLAYVLYDDAKATFENLRKRTARRRFEQAKASAEADAVYEEAKAAIVQAFRELRGDDKGNS